MTVDRRRLDASVLLSVYVVLLLGIPSILVVKGVGAVGSPATMFGLALLGWWSLTRVVPGMSDRSRQPLRRAVGFLIATVLVSYVAAGLRGYDGVEQRAADRGLLAILSVAGVALVAADGLRSRRDLDRVLQWLVRLGAVMAVVGLGQFQGKLDIAALFRFVPGLTFNSDAGFVFTAGVRRVASTAGHPIEFGMILTVILPIALHRAFFAAPGRPRRRAWALTALIGVGIPLSISRSAVVGLAVFAVILFPSWPRARRRSAYKVLPGFLVLIRLVAPGTLGTLKTGLLGIGNDPSVQGRTEDYAIVGRFIGERPVFGRGFATFLPDRYVLLDNQYIGLVVELGVVGLTIMLVLFATAIVLAVTARRRSLDAEARDLGMSLAAAVAIAASGLATFDALGFASITGVMFLMFGCAGALWRLTPAAPRRTDAPDAPNSPAESGSRVVSPTAVEVGV